MASVRPIPEGYHSITPALTCRDAGRAIDFYKKAFGATEIVHMSAPDGKVAHAELRIGDSVIVVSDEFPGMSAAPAPTRTPSVYFYLYVTDADAVFKGAVAAGCRVDMPLTDMFWGDRYGKVTDPFGHSWGIATRTEDVTPEEMERRGAEFMAKAAQSRKAAGQG
jgi:PhnB protein